MLSAFVELLQGYNPGLDSVGLDKILGKYEHVHARATCRTFAKDSVGFYSENEWHSGQTCRSVTLGADGI